MKAWHTGGSAYTMPDGTHLTGLNSHSIGIHLANSGRLKRKDDKLTTWNGEQVPDDDVLEAAHKSDSNVTMGWERYTSEQIDVLIEMLRTLTKTYGIKVIICHDDVAPARKIDPGPALPMEEIRRRAFIETTYADTATKQ